MDALPSFYVQDCAITRRLGRRVERTAGGALRGRIMYDEPVYSIDIKSDYLTTAEKDALLTFYGAHLDIVFLYTSAHEPAPRTFAVSWTEEPEDVHVIADFWTVRLRLEGVAA